MTQTGATGGAAPDPMDQFLRRLAQAQKLTGIETTTQMAELLWLATRLEPALPPATVTVAQAAEAGKASGDVEGNRSSPLRPSSASPPEPLPETVDVVASSPSKALPAQVLPVQIADPAMLANPLGVIKALRPLLQKVDAGTGSRLNEPATVDFMARTDLCVPKLQPEQEAWLDIILVVDRSSASMIIWQRLVQDIVRTLRCYGAFRDVRVFDLLIAPAARSATTEPVMLRSHPHRPQHHPKELIDQRGRRLVIVLSDTTAAHWWQGRVTPLLTQWGQHMPVVLWQMLPPWLWQRTALGRGTPVSIRNALPGAPNQRWQMRLPASASPTSPASSVAIPVVTSEAYDLTRWSQLLVGKPVVMPGFLLPQTGVIPELTSTIDLTDFAIADRRMQRFLRLASPEAQSLLMLLAAAPVITLPIVRLIRSAQLPEVTSPLPIAEIFTSGLLAWVEPPSPTAPPHPEQSQEPTHPQELVQYDFVGKVRDALLTGKWLSPPEAGEVINIVSKAIAKRFNRLYPQTFQAYLLDPKFDLPEGLEGVKTFATITADILASFGTPYQELVQQLREGAHKHVVPVTELDPYGNRLQTFTYEVAEYLNFPTLTDIDFTEAFLSDDTWPPDLQSDAFKTVTVQLRPTESAEPELTELMTEPFEFTIATLSHNPYTDAWDVIREPGQAYRYVERLPNDVFLEMVLIPGDTFLMGSPEDESERFDAEGPQHAVTVASCFMGRYPVTQAQWRAVASLPRVNRDLAATLSRFQGDDRPVEQVSWEDAMEFCARLAAHTGRSYRLPSEAEWEYACRAGTQTPFHFGDTISTDVANYDGRATFVGGPVGEYRAGTNRVDHFGLANAFGLCDMHGNVLEWCEDNYHSRYEGAPTDGSAWVDAERTGGSRILRGGSWCSDPRNCRSASRFNTYPGSRDFIFGFRVCCSPPRA